MAMSRKANGALAAKPVARISESRKVIIIIIIPFKC